MSERENENAEFYLIMCFFVILIFFNFLIVNSFADRCSIDNHECQVSLHPWYVFFLRFQTLITGVLAIVAALFTVQQMRRDGIQNQQQHRQQTALAVSDKREAILARKVNLEAYLVDTKTDLTECRKLRIAAEGDQTYPEKLMEIIKYTCRAYEELYPPLEDNLIGPIYEESYQNSKKIIDHVKTMVELADMMLKEVGERADFNPGYQSRALEVIDSVIEYCSLHIDEDLELLDRIQEKIDGFEN